MKKLFLVFLLVCSSVFAADLHWENKQYVWYYNKQGEPDWMNAQTINLLFLAAKQWEECGITIRFGGYTDILPGTEDHKNVIGWKYNSNTASGRADYFYNNRNELTESDITLYEAIYTKYRNSGYNVILELYKTIVHEFGHALGLNHSGIVSDAMAVSTNQTDPNWILPSRNDLNQCRKIYSNL